MKKKEKEKKIRERNKSMFGRIGIQRWREICVYLWLKSPKISQIRKM